MTPEEHKFKPRGCHRSLVDIMLWCKDYKNLFLIWAMGARCSSVVRAFAHGAMGCRIDPSWDVPIELFLIPASAPKCNEGRGMCYHICGMVHIKERVAHVVAAGFLSHYLNGPLPYVQCHITVNKMCWVCRYIKHFLPSYFLYITRQDKPKRSCLFHHQQLSNAQNREYLLLTKLK